MTRLLHSLLLCAHDDATLAEKLQEAMRANILKALACAHSRRDPRIVLTNLYIIYHIFFNILKKKSKRAQSFANKA